MKKIFFILMLALAATSCKLWEGLSDTAAELTRGEVVARVGKHRLHKSELQKFIPAGVSPEDSAGLAQGYIKAWAEELLMLEMAQSQLSKQQKDVSAELEEYRRSLLKYRYEQLYINQRLDTLVTEEELTAYYKANPDKFKLDRPVLKSRYLIIPADSRSLKAIRSRMSSEDDTDALYRSHQVRGLLGQLDGRHHPGPGTGYGLAQPGGFHKEFLLRVHRRCRKPAPGIHRGDGPCRETRPAGVLPRKNKGHYTEYKKAYT